MSIRQALYKVRRMGFTTIKQDGTWWISKPYHRASHLIDKPDGVEVALLQNHSMHTYIKAEDLE